MRAIFLILAVGLAGATVACAGKDTGSGAVAGTSAGDAQTPPTGADAVESWLADGQYTSWHCESAPHDARSPSAHNKNRICSNDLLSAHGDGEYPVGAAAVKELYDDSGTKVTGHAVYLHTKAGTTGDTWYWYERTAGGLEADGVGSSGTPKDVCVGCHAGAGSDAKHPGHDFVYTQVK